MNKLVHTVNKTVTGSTILTCTCGASSKRTTVTVVKVDLTASDLYGTVSETDEETIGAFVHFNLDNDDSSNNSIGAPKHPGGDYLEPNNPVTGENDLKSLGMSLTPSFDFGSVVLTISGCAKIWKSPTKGSTNLLLASGSKTWDLTNSTERNEFYSLCTSGVFVEGVNTGSGEIILKYIAPSGAEIHRDTIKYTFIAADCGRQPKTVSPNERNIGASLGNLVHCEWSITDDTDTPPYYNCIAWSVGETTAWYVDVEAHRMHIYDIVIDYQWGNGDGTMTTAELDAFYAAKGYSPTASGPSDATVMYYSGFHGARKKNCGCGAGKWIMFESKCGEWVKIEHVWNQLSGGIYGSPTRYYK